MIFLAVLYVKQLMYADDTSLLVSSSDPLCLQNSLNLNMCKIASWFQKNHLTLNISKTKLMLFGTPKISVSTKTSL